MGYFCYICILLCFTGLVTADWAEGSKRAIFAIDTSIDQQLSSFWSRFVGELGAENVAKHAKRSEAPGDTLEHPHTPGHHCGSDALTEAKGLREIHSRISQRLRANGLKGNTRERRDVQALYEPIRLFAYTARVDDDPQQCKSVGQMVSSYTCTEADVVTDFTKTAVKNYIIPAASQIIASLIAVERVSGNLILDQTYHTDAGNPTCGEGNVPIPAQMFSTGVPNADYFAAFSIRPASSPQTIASAAPCNVQTLSDGLGRVLAGGINIAPKFLQNAFQSEFQFKEYVRIVCHEIFHALGFINFMYDSYRDDAFNLYSTPLVNATERGGLVYRMATPRVVAWAREQYNCSSLSGYEIENVESAGTGGSHWEQRTGMNEVMAGLNWRPTAITNLTLALFADMGYYAVNPRLGEPMVWGWKAGCPFAAESCSASTWSVQGGWCTTSGQEDCTLDRGAKGTCFLQSAESLPAIYHYLPGPTAGRLATVDYCPVIVPYSDKMCEDTANSAEIGVGEYYGLSSRCFMLTDSTPRPVCFKTRCNNGEVEVSILDVWTPCPSGTTINGLRGTIACPAASERFCTRKESPISTEGVVEKSFVAAPMADTPPLPKLPPKANIGPPPAETIAAPLKSSAPGNGVSLVVLIFCVVVAAVKKFN
eukprot:TRINITY_DN915_c0_g1_i2.p1 TRINITY_DN915_c0_g1~~TRINITY_DN915_c0_g1_i2.p1  ORF type:complete len:651 (+),score=53.79 TRINITY_DN915_c0_g1_i2:26-1978(+)